jgi:hypothetical protein
LSDNPFVLKSSEYRRNINVLKTYVEDTATYLHLMTQRPIEECLTFVKSSLRPGGCFEFKDPDILFTLREENGDRFKKIGKLSVYLADAIKNKELIAPTLTTYINPQKKQSLLVSFIDGNVKARGTAKKAMFTAKVAGDNHMFAIKKIEQTNKKLSNNSISGAHVSASTPLYNKTAHSTLTSNCRSTSGYGNANNEKFLCGNRHYWSPDIVRNNIVSIINHSDYAAIASAMGQFGIRHPTIDETMECIRYSASLYWKTVRDYTQIEELVKKLTDIQRSAFVYTGDLYHLMKFNDSVVRDFITKLSRKILVEHPDPKSVISSASDDVKSLASQICSKELRGTSIRDIEGKPDHAIFASTVANITQVVEEYRNLIRAFWVTENVPASVAHFPDSIRRTVLTSDTDSTIFTVQDWVSWHQGSMKFTDESYAVAASLIFLASQTITHILARMSANFGIEEKRIHQIAMKNEFKFDVFVPTQVAKHYYALISCQEGNIFKEYEKEIKGVHLKSSNAPRVIMDEAKKMMEFIMNSVVENKMISINEIMTQIADIERGVVASVRKGSFEYFRKGQIKTADSYKKSAEESPYLQYTMWEEVFSPKYGSTQSPPYMSVKLSTELNSPAKTQEWIDGMTDKELANRLSFWLAKNNRKHLGSTFMLPEQCISSNGIPEEFLSIIGMRRIVLESTRVFYILLESLGVYMLNSRITRLCMDSH